MEVRIERLGKLGDGLGQGVVVPGALPGETVRGAVEAGRMDAPKIVTPSPLRRRAPCAAFGRCGGCVLQHVPDAWLAEWKLAQLSETLARHGLAAPVRPMATSPPRSRRRAVFSGRRTRGGVLLGFHARRSDQIVDHGDCHILAPPLRAARPALADIVAATATRRGALRLLATATEAGVAVDVDADAPGPEVLARLGQVADAHGLARIGFADAAIRRHPAWIRLGPARIDLPPWGFLQATEAGEAALQRAVTEAMGPPAPALDLFAGAGTFTLPLAQDRPVHAVEANAAALQALAHAARTPGLRSVTTERRDLGRDPIGHHAAEAAVIDPPRAGAEAQVRALTGPRRLAMVSCDPDSFARDTAILVSRGWRLRWIQPVDQFLWSPHLELVAALDLPG